jgi:hypothetical protein
MKIKKALIVLIITTGFVLTACSELGVQPADNPDTPPETLAETQPATTTTQSESTSTQPITISSPPSETVTSAPQVEIEVPKRADFLTFEKLLTEYATDVVVARYVTHRPFGETQTLIEIEFAVIERVLGSAPDKIFVYASVEELESWGLQNGFTNAEYMLSLEKNWRTFALTHDNNYMLINGIIVNLDEPSHSTMARNSLSAHSAGLDFNNKNLSRETIISYVRELTKNNPTGFAPIRSEQTKVIINNSPNVLIVEITRPLILSDGTSTDWLAATDIYYANVIKTLKGSISPESETIIIFLAGAVNPGERYIVAIHKRCDENAIYHLTSRNSLFQMSQLDEIVKIIGGGAQSRS